MHLLGLVALPVFIHCTSRHDRYVNGGPEIESGVLTGRHQTMCLGDHRPNFGRSRSLRSSFSGLCTSSGVSGNIEDIHILTTLQGAINMDLQWSATSRNDYQRA